METPNSENIETNLDRATANRLARLRTMPLDTHAFDERLRGKIPLPSSKSRQLFTFFRPLRAVAAGLIVLGLAAAILLSSSSGPALASASQMAQVHYDLVSGKTPAIKVDSIEAANKLLSDQWPQCPELPKVPEKYEMACCMKSVKGKKVACMVLRGEAMPVTMTVAKSDDMKMPSSPTIVRDGVTYHVQSSGALNMVTSQRNGRWVCLIGEISSERLMDLLTKLRF